MPSERLAYAEALLKEALKRSKRLKIGLFIDALTEPRHLSITRPTAESYWEAIKARFEHNNQEVWLKEG